MITRIAFSLLLILASRPAEAGRYLAAIAVAVGSTAGGKVDPVPAPTPSGECDNCNGTGRLGDGTVSVDCPLCVDGKVTTAVACSPAKPAEILSDQSEGQPAKSTRPVVVKQPGPMWLQDGHSATVDHLVNVHGIDRSTASRMTQAQRDIAHSNAHNAGRRVAAPAQSGCPNGQCPSPSRSRGLFRRR